MGGCMFNNPNSNYVNNLEHLFGIKNQYKNYQNHIEPLIEKNWLNLMFPVKPKHRKQKYFTPFRAKKN
jgi:hypothetical protein